VRRLSNRLQTVVQRTETDRRTDPAAPCVLYIDNDNHDGTWGYFGSLPISCKTALYLRNINLGMEGDMSDLSGLDLRQLVFDKCYSTAVHVYNLVEVFQRLETLVLSEGGSFFPVSLVATLPASIRRVHVLQHTFFIDIDEDQPDNPHELPHLESFTFTFTVPVARASGLALAASDSIHHLQRVIESNIVAPQCTFKYLRSRSSPESLLPDALAAFNL
jgi:hypothetical protein